jgi:hypothetical protein
MEIVGDSEIFEISTILHGYKYQKSGLFTVTAAGTSNMDISLGNMKDWKRVRKYSP